MIDLRPYDDLSAMAVIQRLDIHDHAEAEVIRGAPTGALQLFAEWRAVQGPALLSMVAATMPERGGQPFALFLLGDTGQAGVAQAALLARDHRHFRKPLAALAMAIRNRMPGFCAEHGVRRIEARAWVGHPTASTLLTALGFRAEADMPGFGGTGAETLRQFAFVPPLNRS